MSSDKVPDSPSKFPCVHLWMTRRIWHCIKSHLRPYSTHPFNSCISQMMWTCILDLSPCLCCLHHCVSLLLEGVEGKGNQSSQKISYSSAFQARFPQLLPWDSENHSSNLVCQTSLNITTACFIDKHASSQKCALSNWAVWQYFAIC